MAVEEKKDFFSRIEKWATVIQVIVTIGAIALVVWQGMEKAMQSKTTAERVGWILAGFVIVAGIVIFSYAMSKWDKLSERVEIFFKFNPALRRWCIILGGISSIVFGFFQLVYWDGDWGFKALAFAYFGLLFPAALVSLVKEDRKRDESFFGREITRELFLQNPQAALEHAFTAVETRLRTKVGGDANNSGDALINEAFANQKGKLKFEMDGRDYTSQLRNFLSGSYTLFRNPLHHSLVDLDENTALSMYAVAGLMMHYIDASEPRETSEVVAGQESKITG